MAKPRGVDAKLSRLRALRQETPAPEHVAELRTALADRSNLVVAEAAEIVGVRVLSDLAADLVAAFHRFMIDATETDKTCRAKTTIVETLNKIEYDQDDVFLIAIRHVQMEPRWGEPEDTAGPLRACAAFGLLRINYHDLMLVLTDLLADREKTARSGAAQALGESRSPAAIPLLRFKARLGDKEPAVVADCLAALMVADPKQSLSFVAEFLRHPVDEIAEGAAFALGESRRPEALETLKDFWPRARSGTLQEVLLLAIALTRLPAALEFLLDVLANDRLAGAAALSALAIHKHNEPIKKRIAAIVADKDDVVLQQRFTKKFDVKE